MKTKATRTIPITSSVSWIIVGLALMTSVIAPDLVVASTGEISIPYTKYVLDNGLTLIVHEDHKAPIVAVNVWYHVGSKNEKPGKTGFAHLFEHLMFNGSENYNDDYFGPFDRIGATDMNGTTNFDRTNYFQNVPSSALDVALWMESDRMGHLLGAIDQARLDEQRGVVQNEKRQGENQPYGTAFRLIFENTYPQGHPYSWSVIGSLEDLDAASLDDVHEWFEKYYGAANAVIAIAGDIEAEEALEKVEKYFGDIPSGPPVDRYEEWIAKREHSHRQVIQDRVPQGRIYKAWNMPAWGTADDDYLDLVSELLTTGKTSRLYRRLVYDEQIATDVASFAYSRELGGLFILWATAAPGQDLASVEKAIDEEIERFIADGPNPEELERVKTQARAEFIRGIERIGGFGGTSDVLAMNEVFGGSPDFYKTSLERIASAGGSDLRRAAESWLASGAFALEIHPFPEFSVGESSVDRSQLPTPESFPEVLFPRTQRARLSNGLEVILATRRAVPVVTIDLQVDAGYSSDHGRLAGTANLAMDMLDEGTADRSALEISDDLSRLGATLETGSNLDTSSVRLSALKENLEASLEIFADVILRPTFDENELQRLKKQQLAAIQREKARPFTMALRVFPPLIYGPDHAYSLPFTGSGTEESVSALTRESLVDFHRVWLRPNNATLIVVGDTELTEILPQLERLFDGWDGGEIPTKNLAAVEHQQSSLVYLIDRPDSLQSVIIAGHVAPPKANPDEIAIEAMNEVLGGSFSARINLNLREDKHWSYGARSVVVDARGPRPFFVFAPVQTDKTKESMEEIRKELEGIVAERPPSAEEAARAKDSNTLTLPGRWETADAVIGSIAEQVQYGLSEDHWDSYPDKVRGLDVEVITAAAKQVLRPAQTIWVVVGDRAKIEDGIRALELGELHLIDADGKPLARP